MRRPIKAILFDLDNTLYDEREYIFGAFTDISTFLSRRIPTRKGNFYGALIEEFEKKGSLYPYLFDDTLREFDLYDKELVMQVVTIFRQASPEIKLYDGARDVLLKLKRQYALALITNGNVEMQKRKVQLLGISDIFQEIVYAQIYGTEEKPGVLPYKHALRGLSIEPMEAIYVGDNPYLDFIGARKLGIITVRLLKGEFAAVTLSEEYEADYTINQLNELFEVLNLITEGKRPVQNRRV